MLGHATSCIRLHSAHFKACRATCSHALTSQDMAGRPHGAVILIITGAISPLGYRAKAKVGVSVGVIR